MPAATALLAGTRDVPTGWLRTASRSSTLGADRRHERTADQRSRSRAQPNAADQPRGLAGVAQRFSRRRSVRRLHVAGVHVRRPTRATSAPTRCSRRRSHSATSPLIAFSRAICRTIARRHHAARWSPPTHASSKPSSPRRLDVSLMTSGQDKLDEADAVFATAYAWRPQLAVADAVDGQRRDDRGGVRPRRALLRAKRSPLEPLAVDALLGKVRALTYLGKSGRGDRDHRSPAHRALVSSATRATGAR